MQAGPRSIGFREPESQEEGGGCTTYVLSFCPPPSLDNLGFCVVVVFGDGLGFGFFLPLMPGEEDQ